MDAPRAIHNADIAAVFGEIAAILEIEGANPYRVQAYRNAVRTVQGIGIDLPELIQHGAPLPRLPGIGADLAGKIHEIAARGTCELREQLRRKVPAALLELLGVAGLGPKRVKRLYHDLGIETPEQLLHAVKAGRVRRLHGFGEKTEARILQALEQQHSKPRMPLALAAVAADALAEHLRQVPGIGRVTVAGSYRRMRETVGDLDILVTARRPSEVVKRFVSYAGVRDVLAQGPTRSGVRLDSGLQVDLRVLRPEAEGAALVYFTGSKAHNIAIRRRAQERGLKLSEYGVFHGRRRVAGDTEASVYQAIGLPLIPPELREDRGEVEAALAGALPRLVERQDLKGDLHAHTRASDGADSLEEMAEAARAAGLEYLAVTEHSGRLGADALVKHLQAIDRLNARVTGVTLLKGIEVAILENGDFDVPDSVLAALDVVVAAVRSGFDLSRAKQTRRLRRAMEHRYLTLLAHPAGRLIGEREALDADMAAVMTGARERGCFLELNAQPQRMDLPDVLCRQARDHGVPVVVSADARATADFGLLRWGAGQARRGWLEEKDIVNTRTLPQVKALLRACFA